MPGNKSSLLELGSIETNEREFRAQINIRGDDARQIHIRAPLRESEKEAQKDLEHCIGNSWDLFCLIAGITGPK